MKFEGLLDQNVEIHQLDQYEMWRKLIGFSPQINKKICNPLRNDRNPGAWFAFHNGYLVLVDFAWIYKNLNVFQAYKLLNRIVEPIVLQGFNLNPDKDFKFYLDFESKPYTLKDKKYWSDYGITVDQLEEEDVYSVSKYWHNSRMNPDTLTHHIVADECYSIVINDRKKIYRPNNPNPRKKFLTDFTEKTIGGKMPIDPAKGPLIYTKSFKDYKVLSNLNFNSRYVNSETNRYLPTGIYIYDNDEAGKQNVDYINKNTSLKAHTCPLSKDIALSYIQYGKDVLLRELSKLIYHETMVLSRC
jgi:hypothetical protein